MDLLHSGFNVRLFPLLLALVITAPFASERRSIGVSDARPSIVERSEYTPIALKYRQQLYQFLDLVSGTSSEGKELPLIAVISDLHAEPSPTLSFSDPCYGFMSLQL